MHLIKECNLCKHTSFHEIVRGNDLMYRIPGEFILVECQNCGLRFVNPQPDNELAAYYPQEYYSVADKIQRNKLSEFVYKTYFSDSGSKVLRALFFPFYPILRSTMILPGKTLLDIGCGSGVFLSRMKHLGMSPSGVDPYITTDIPELGIKKRTLEQVNGTFDVITMNNVLEHVPDPDATFAQITRLLANNGVAIIGVPSGTSLLFKLFKRKWAELDLPRHLFLFTEKTLREYAKKYQLDVRKVRYNSVPFEFTGSIFYSIDNHKKLAQSKLVHNFFINALFLPLCHLLNLFKRGSRIELTLSHAASSAEARAKK